MMRVMIYYILNFYICVHTFNNLLTSLLTTSAQTEHLDVYREQAVQQVLLISVVEAQRVHVERVMLVLCNFV